MSRSGKRPVIATMLALLGGAAVITGSLLTWIDAGQGVTVGTQAVTGTPKGIELQLGQVALGAGVAALVLAVLLSVAPRAGRVWGALLLLASAAAITAGLVSASQPQQRYAAYAARQASGSTSSTSEIEASLNRLFEVSSLQAKPGVGVYVAVGGGGALALAGLYALFRRKRAATRPNGLTEAESTMFEDATEAPGSVPEQALEVPSASDPPSEPPEDVATWRG
jgi:Tryptophan-associated transmembrane protein (Trp_oprn_chp)